MQQLHVALSDEHSKMLDTVCKASDLDASALVRHLIVALHSETSPSLPEKKASRMLRSFSKTVYWQRKQT